jgi:hypothetical protein
MPGKPGPDGCYHDRVHKPEGPARPVQTYKAPRRLQVTRCGECDWYLAAECTHPEAPPLHVAWDEEPPVLCPLVVELAEEAQDG